MRWISEIHKLLSRASRNFRPSCRIAALCTEVGTLSRINIIPVSRTLHQLSVFTFKQLPLINWCLSLIWNMAHRVNIFGSGFPKLSKAAEQSDARRVAVVRVHTKHGHSPQPGDRGRYEFANSPRSHAKPSRVTRLPILSSKTATGAAVVHQNRCQQSHHGSEHMT